MNRIALIVTMLMLAACNLTQTPADVTLTADASPTNDAATAVSTATTAPTTAPASTSAPRATATVTRPAPTIVPLPTRIPAQPTSGVAPVGDRSGGSTSGGSTSSGGTTSGGAASSGAGSTTGSSVGFGVDVTVSWGSTNFVYNSAVSPSWSVIVVPANPASPSIPNWQVAPSYNRFTFDNYVLAGETAALHVYPTARFPDILQYGEPYTQQQNALNALLSARPDAATLSGNQLSGYAGMAVPFLPFLGAGQVFRSNVQYIDFNGGSGVRFVTLFQQTNGPILETDLFYTFQGVTADGRYYIAATFPVRSGLFPADMAAWGTQALPADFNAYVTDAVNRLNGLQNDAFTPSLNLLDAAMRSLSFTGG